MPTRHSVTKRIPASAEAIFSVVSSPQGHADIDGSGMLVSPQAADRPAAVGDTFGMNMDREPLGDLPMGKYEVLNYVTRIQAPVLFEWGVGVADRPKVGHVYGYELVPVGPGETDVTSYCDWSAIPEAYQHRFPIVPLTMLEQTMDNLDRLMRDRA